jgi:hypothetical protein
MADLVANRAPDLKESAISADLLRLASLLQPCSLIPFVSFNFRL